MPPISIPVIMFHSVRPTELAWVWNHISCPPDLFEAYLRYLTKHKYVAVLLPDVVAYIHGEKQLPDRAVALTFDDGYLDNWTVIAPLLQKYGFSGTVFVNPSFVDPREIIRRQVPPGNSVRIAREQVDGFMSWPEMREAMKANIFDFQSHGMTHTWYPSTDKIIDFHHPGDDYPWLAWNARPERRYLWLAEDQSNLVPYGVPVYEHDKAIIARRFFENEDLKTLLAAFISANGGEVFFNRKDWREALSDKAAESGLIGRSETEDEYLARVEWELATSKLEISRRLNKEVNIVCWPGGGQNEIARNIAEKVGYIAWTVRKIKNTFGSRKTPEIGRIAIPILKAGPAGRVINRLVFAYQIEGYRGSQGWRQAKWLMKSLRRFVGRNEQLI